MAKDHQKKKLTKKEAELAQALYALQRNFELVVQNTRAQIRAIAIACGVKPERFVEAFHDIEQQTKFQEKQIELETNMMKEAQEKAAAEKAANQVNPDNVPPMPSMKDIEDMLEGEGEVIT